MISIVQFIAEPSSPSQVLYLFLISIINLLWLAFSRPYENPYDDMLSNLCAIVESVSFLIALIIVANINDSYSNNLLLSFQISCFFVMLFIIAPYAFLMKLEYFKKKVETLTDTVMVTLEKQTGYLLPSLSGLDIKSRLTIEMLNKDDSMLLRSRSSIYADNREENEKNKNNEELQTSDTQRHKSLKIINSDTTHSPFY
jgi:hypothetical protein